MQQPSQRSGMGAIPYHDGTTIGTTFRLWAPHASSVWVAGSFNNWQKNADALYNEGNGYWSADIESAHIDDLYRYVILGPYTPVEGQWRTDPYCRSVKNNPNSDGTIISNRFDWGIPYNTPPWNEWVIYELHVASFTLDGPLPGDFTSILTRLNDLRDLGINTIEILPITGFPGPYSLGYNPAFPFDIESNYGTPLEFKDFVKAAHQRGFSIILDVVINHFGPEDLDACLWCLDGWSQNQMGGIYFYNDWRANAGNFGSKNRPDYSREEVQHFLMDSIFLWLEEYQIDGLRIDSTVNIRNVKGNNNDPSNDLPEGWSLLQQINDRVDQEFSWKMIIAEDLQNNDWITYTTTKKGAGFDSQWDAAYYWVLRNILTTPFDEGRDLLPLKEQIEKGNGAMLSPWIRYINNHDECALINNKWRLPNDIDINDPQSWAAKKRSTLGAAVVFTSPGIPMMFMGDEFLATGQWNESQSLDWGLRTQNGGIWNLYRDLIHLRRNWNNQTSGLRGPGCTVFHLNNSDKIMALHRFQYGGAGDDVLIIFNFSTTAFTDYWLGFPRDGAWQLRFNSDWSGYDTAFGNHPSWNVETQFTPKDGYPFSGSVSIGPYTALIYSQ